MSTSISYNVLNLPQAVRFADGHEPRYTYDAGGAQAAGGWYPCHPYGACLGGEDHNAVSVIPVTRQGWGVVTVQSMGVWALR